MPKKLVIVESPAKARTVGRFLGKDFAVEASVGHIRDLPLNRLGVDVEDDFRPRYVIPERKKEVVKKLRSLAKDSRDIYLATDPDREGEAISWHLIEALKLGEGQRVQRVEFHEITREAVAAAFAHPRDVDQHLVDAQQTRRILDRLVGYKLSPLLRQKVGKKGLSAGRVQSVAVKLVVDREREIDAFKQVEYWSLGAELLKHKGRAKKPFVATLASIAGEKALLPHGDDAAKAVADLDGAVFTVGEIRRRESLRNPSPPFITSTLQQEASRRLGFSAKRTMAVAQQLYEGVQIRGEGSIGLITYMRTDSTNVAASAQQLALEYIAARFGSEYVPPRPRVYRTRAKGAQEAHEAIRPTSVLREPDAIMGDLSPEQLKLYRLIWQRFVASQMASAILDYTVVDIDAAPAKTDAARPYLFRASGSVVRFQGFMAVYIEGRDDGERADDEGDNKALPALLEGEPLDLVKLVPEQHFTQPPPRYTEATLVKALEENGIGRPSTYAPTISTIQDRGYVERSGKLLQPTHIGLVVNDLLVAHFPTIVDIGFTAQMEEQLDDIANENTPWIGVLTTFYGPFSAALSKAEQDMPEVSLKPELTGEQCEQCGKDLVVKFGRFGKFIACSGYPACRNARSIMVKVGASCPRKCGGDIVEKKTKRKRVFYSCSNYPACDFAVWNKPLPDAEQPCKSCGGFLVESARGYAKCETCARTIAREDVAATAPAIAASAS